MTGIRQADPDDLLRTFAEALRDTIRDAPVSPNDDPESVYTDLAVQLIMRLSGSLTIIPKTLFDQMSSSSHPSILLASATQGLLDALPECSFEGCSDAAVVDRDRCAKHEHGIFKGATAKRFVEAVQKLDELGFRRKSLQ